LAGRKDRDRAAFPLKAQPLDPDVEEIFEDDEQEGVELTASDLQLGIAVLDWWEVARRHDVLDESSSGYREPSLIAAEWYRNGLRYSSRMVRCPATKKFTSAATSAEPI